MPTPFWLKNPEAWDQPILSLGRGAQNRIALPGVSKVKVRRQRDVDVKKPPGSSGGTLTNLGMKPADVEIRSLLWLPNHLRIFEEILAELMPTPGKFRAAPVAIRHPKCQLYQVSKVLLVDVTGPDDASGVKGAREVTFKFIEFRPSVADSGTFKAKTNLAGLGDDGTSGKYFPWSEQADAERSAAALKKAQEEVERTYVHGIVMPSSTESGP